MVNAMFDGMNLIAKEGPLVNERNGVSLLCENTGAHEELAEFALSVNPFDVQEQADAIHRALTMSAEERSWRAAGPEADRDRARPGRLGRRPAGRHRGQAQAATRRSRPSGQPGSGRELAVARRRRRVGAGGGALAPAARRAAARSAAVRRAGGGRPAPSRRARRARRLRRRRARLRPLEPARPRGPGSALRPPAPLRGHGRLRLLPGSRVRPDAISAPAGDQRRPAARRSPTAPGASPAPGRPQCHAPAQSASPRRSRSRPAAIVPALDGRSLRPHAAARPDRSRGAARRRDRRGRVADPAGRRRDRRQPRLGPAPAGVRDRPPSRGRVPALPVPGRQRPCSSGSTSACGSSTAVLRFRIIKVKPGQPTAAAAGPAGRPPPRGARARATPAWPPAPRPTRRRPATADAERTPDAAPADAS